MINPTMVRILIEANQNSHSPKKPKKLMATTTTRQIEIQRALLIVSFHKLIKTAAADNSAGRMITQLYQ